MYPLFSQQPPVGQFLNAVYAWARERRVHMVELGGKYFSEADLTAHGYKTHTAQTYRVDLSGGASEVWKNLKPAMRNKIHKAEKSGVVITHDTCPEFPHRFFDMLQAVFTRQGLSPTYGLSRVETVFRTLADSGNVLPLTAWRDGEPLASVILLTDSRAAYFWGGASYETAYPFGANDIIHWHALRLAIERGLSVYDTCGGGDYKTKFGGQLIALPAGYIAINPVFGAIRAAVQRTLRARSVVLGRAKRLRRQAP
jgi:lipid II:glycine glycyltransferase (peptidoglycan interpeptide bridge formation enzyme)